MIAWAGVAIVLILAALAFLCWSVERASREYRKVFEQNKTERP